MFNAVTHSSGRARRQALRLLSLFTPPPPDFRMVNAKSRRNSSARLPLLLGALALFSLLLTVLPPSAVLAQATVPLAPALTTERGNNQMKLAWTSGGNGGAAITSWEYHQGTSSSATAPTMGWTAIAGSGAATTSHTVTGLTNGTELFFRVRAVNSVGNGAASAEASATPQLMAPTVPPAPGGLNSSISAHVNYAVSLTWASGGDGGATITRWEMRRSTDGGTNWNPDWTPIPGSGAATRGYIVPGLSGGVTYTFQVRARNSVGPGAASPKSTTTTPRTTPLAPFLMVTPGHTQVKLTWVSGDDGGAAIDRWDVRHTTDGNLDTETWTAIPSSGPATTTHTVTGLTNGTAVLFQVRAHNSVGNGVASAEASATPREQGPPGQPTGLTATPDNRQVTLRWDAGTNDRGVVIDRWEYRRKAGAGNYGGWIRISTDPATVQHVVRSLSNGTLYTFQVRAHNAEGDGVVSAEVSATPLVVRTPARPTGLTATGGPGQVTLMWDAGTDDGGVAIDRWEYRQKAGNGAYGGWMSISTDPATVSHVVVSLVSYTRYTYQVRAHNPKGNGSSATASATTTAWPPAQPTGLTATAGNSQVELAWTSGGDGGLAITSWQVHQGTTSSATPPTTGWKRISGSGAATMSHTIYRLTNGTQLFFRVRAVNGVGNGAAIDRWDWRVASDGTLDTETWRSTRVLPAHDATRANTDTAIIVLTLVAGKEYFFQMRAHNAVGDGAPSAVVSATPYGLPSAPTLKAKPGKGAGEVTLTWRPVYDGKAAIDRYEYRYSADLILDGFSYVRLPNGQRKLLGPDDAGNTEAWTAIPDSAKNGANDDSFTVKGLRGGIEHRFQVRAHNAVGDGLESWPITTAMPWGVPWAPTLTATPGDGQVTLSWVLGGGGPINRWDGGRTIDRFEYRQSTDGALETETWRAIPSSRAGRANAASFTVTGLTNGTEHRFQVRAHNSVGNGDPSAEVSATPGVPLAPTSLTAEAGNRQVKLTWVSGGDGGTAIDRWDWRWTADGRLDTETWNRVPSSGPTTTTHTVTSLTNGTAALFQVRAVNSNGVGAPSPVVSATPMVSGAGGSSTPEPSTRPGRAVNLAASEADGAVTLTWDAPADGGAPSGYMILRRAPGLGQRDLRTLTDDSVGAGAPAPRQCSHDPRDDLYGRERAAGREVHLPGDGTQRRRARRPIPTGADYNCGGGSQQSSRVRL